jgi:polyphosphate kinase
MAAPKKKTSTTSRARKAATGAAGRAASSAAKGAAKGAARTAAKGAAKGAAKTVAASSDRIGRGTRWTDEQVALLLKTVTSSPTAKEAFELVARQIDKSAGTVAQKYYNLQKANGAPASAKRGSSGGRPAGRPAGRAAGAGVGGGGLPTATELRALTVDELTGLAMRVKTEIDRRRTELDAASKALKG